MPSPLGSILRASSRTREEPLRVLTFPTHERTQSNLADVNALFFLLQTPQVKTWNSTYAELPENHILLDATQGDKQLPRELDFDVILSQNKFGQYQIASQLARQLHLPLISFEHTLVHPAWSAAQLEALKGLRGHVNVFISNFSRERWGWGSEALVLHHGVDTELFSPAPVGRKPHVLSVVNQFKEEVRRWCCGYDFWVEAISGLPWKHLGEAPDGWSSPAKDVPDLVRHYREAAVFVDTASASPIPTVLLEAMACGCVVVSRGNAMVPEVIEDGVNGFLCPDPQQMKRRLQEILSNPEGYQAIRQEARRTIVERFSLSVYVNHWNELLQHAASLPFLGDFDV